MSEPLRRQIADNLSTMSTEELLAVWVANDRESWSDTAFEVIRDILEARGVEPPQQRELGESATLDEEGGYGEDEPVFYQPDAALSLVRWINRLTPLAVIITILTGLPNVFTIGQTVAEYLGHSPLASFLGQLVALPFGLLLIAIDCALVFFPLKALASILNILMEMEFNSRNALPSSQV